MVFTPKKDPDTATLKQLAAQSESRTLRRIRDEATGHYWYWPAEQATHAEGAAKVSAIYSLPPGAGDIVVIE